MTTRNKLTLRIDDLLTCEPLNNIQSQFFTGWKNKDIHILHGVAGTGKTFISVYKALENVLDKQFKYDRLVIIRSAVPSRDLGHLPGDADEKMAAYEEPYVEICKDLFNRWDAYSRLKEQGKIQFAATSFLRGLTFDKSIVLVDEVQNMNFTELYTVMTRIGMGSKVVFCGDYRQADLKDSGLNRFMNIINLMPSVGRYEFNIDDIVRSDIVKDFIIASLRYEDGT